MPTYEYECKSCGHRFDYFQSIKDEALKICPECGRELRRLINGGTGIIFKGSGFYVTDKSAGKSDAADRPKPKTGNDGSGPAEAKSVESKALEPKATGGSIKPGSSAEKTGQKAANS